MKPKKIPFVSLVDLLATKKDWTWELGDFSISVGYLRNLDQYGFRCYYNKDDIKDIFTQQIYVTSEELTQRYGEITHIIQERYNDMVNHYLKYFDKCGICGGQS